jgi:NitT/TauT family transport system substrate-binding protein
MRRRARPFPLIPFAAGLLLAQAPGAGSPLRPLVPSPAPVHVRLLSTRFLSFAPLAIARAEGYFRVQGLDVEMVPLVSSADAAALLIRGDLDVATGILKIADFNAIARGANLRLVADKGHFETGTCPVSAFVARPGFLDGKGGNGPERVRGARVAVPPLHFTEYALETLLGRKGLTLADLKLARIPASAVAEAFGAGSLDVGELMEPDLSRVVRAGRAVVWKDLQEILPGAQHSAVYFGPRLLGKDRDAGRRFMVAYLQGVRQYNRGKTPRNLDILAAETGLDRELLGAACWPSIRGDGKVDVASVVDFQRWAVGRAALDAVVPPERFWDPSFVDAAGKTLGPQAP